MTSLANGTLVAACCYLFKETECMSDVKELKHFRN